jgi:site-specific DNA-methyltransferase (adenine-specific)
MIDASAVLRLAGAEARVLGPNIALVHADARAWLASLPDRSVHAIVTDPPYGLEYEETDHDKLRGGKGGVWRIPPTLNGVQRAPVPRFTVLGPREVEALRRFFVAAAREWLRVLVPGGHVFLASNPLLSTGTFAAVAEAGFEKRGEIIRLVTTLRGGDRPKGAHDEFPDVSVMPRAAWEPWGLFRKPLDGTVAENLRRWGTGGLRRRSAEEPFRDVIPCAPARGAERRIAPHPSLKPQRFLRQIVRAALPVGTGIVLDPFAGSGSTLAAALHLGVGAIGVERDAAYLALATEAVPLLAALADRGDRSA